MENLKFIVEIVYYLSGPVIAYIAYKALEQVKETKRQVSETKESRIISAKRDSFKIAADKCEYYMSDIIPSIDNLDKAVRENNIDFFESSRIEIHSDGIGASAPFKDDEEFDKVLELPFLEVFNPLESFSLFFTSGVADEKVGYLSVGHTFCDTVEKYAPLIIILSGNKHYNNLLQLFTLWHGRIEKERLEKERAKIDKELNSTSNVVIDTIGTK